MEGGNDSSKFNVVVNDILEAPKSFGTSPATRTNTPPSSSNNNNKGKGKQPTNDSSSPVPKSSASLGLPPLPQSSPASKPHEQANNWKLPSSNITRMMRSILPPYAKISDEAKDTVQECLVEFICFITEEASAQCQREHRKTITADDLLASMSRLGFDNYIDPLNLYLRKYRVSQGLDPHRPSRLHHQLSFTRPTIVGPAVMPDARYYHAAAAGFPPRASHGSASTTPATAVMSSSVSVQHMFGPNYPAPNTGVGFGAYHGSTTYAIPASNVPSPNYPTPNTGVGIGGASHGHNGPINTLASIPKGSFVGANEYGFGMVNNMCCDAGSSNNNAGMFEFNGESGDANLPSFPNSSASDGGVGGSQCFNPFDHFK